MSTILKVDDINVYYGSIHAIKGISFEVKEGESGHLDRRQRRGEIHHPEHHRRPAAEQDRVTSSSWGRAWRRFPATRSCPRAWPWCPEGRRVFLQMTVQENLEMGAFTQQERRHCRRIWKWSMTTSPA